MTKNISSDEDKIKRINIRKIASLKELLDSPIREITLNLTSKKQLNDIKNFFLNRDILICREITKYHEEYIRTSIKDLSNVNFSRKGELTVVISEIKKEKLSFKGLTESDNKKINKLIKKMTIKDIVNKISEDRAISKKLIYNYCLQIKNEN